MKLHDLFSIMDPETLVCIETVDTDEVLFCCPLGDLTIGDIKPLRNRNIGLIFPEKYGKYYNHTGITIYLEGTKED